MIGKERSCFINICIKRRAAVICIAAGKTQEPILRVAKSLGYVVIAVDRDPCAIGFKYSDVQINRSTHDVDGIIKVLEQLVEKYKLEGVINLSAGPPVITTAIICDRYEIPFVPISSAKIISLEDAK